MTNKIRLINIRTERYEESNIVRRYFLLDVVKCTPFWKDINMKRIFRHCKELVKCWMDAKDESIVSCGWADAGCKTVEIMCIELQADELIVRGIND